MTISIRNASKDDFEWLLKYDEHISGEVLLQKISLSEVYVVELDDVLVGWLRYNLFWDYIPFMNMICLLDEYQRKSYGSELVLHWENEMRDKGFKRVLTSTLSNEDAQHFYRKLGYREIGGFVLEDEPLEMMFYKSLK